MEKRRAQVIQLPDNFIGKADREKLASFGAHVIGRGRATRWHWAKDSAGADLFEIYKGGPNESLMARIRRNRPLDVFRAEDAAGRLIVAGTLEHVMAVLDRE
ncbi:MAG: hypothetical protein ACFCVA_16870 [Gammaproteobacteria bacterium]